MEQPISLAGMLPSELTKHLEALPRFRVNQIYKWIIRGVQEFDQMTDIPNSMREDFKNRFSLYSSKIENCLTEKDTKKIILLLKDGLKIECVLLSDGKKRLTACLSTQAGCPAKCVFCKTGSRGFHRNLAYTEIAEQFLHLNRTDPIDNIVVMGMGEPLLNLPELRKAINFFTDPHGLNFSRRRITVSTCGICEGLFDIAKNGPYIKLALSLATADEPLRQKLMPVTIANPLKKIKEGLALFQQNGGGRITLEAPLFGGINTREADAKSIREFSKGINSVVNIIPWNPVAGLEFEGKPLREPNKAEIENYVKLLESQNLKVTKRLHKGRNILGACGQLGE